MHDVCTTKERVSQEPEIVIGVHGEVATLSWIIEAPQKQHFLKSDLNSSGPKDEVQTALSIARKSV